MRRDAAAELVHQILAPIRQGGKCCLAGCAGVGLIVIVLCACLFFFFFPLTTGMQKSEFVWPAGVTAAAGGGTHAEPPGDAGDPGYAEYRSVGWEITSGYGWRPYLGENLTPTPGEYEFHEGIDIAGPGFSYREPVYPLLDGQPFFIGFYPSYYEGAGEAVIVYNVHTIEEAPVQVLYGHLSAYEIEVETYCRDAGRYEPHIPIEVVCPAPVVPERGQPGDRTGPDGKAKFYNGTPGACTARVFWPEGYTHSGPVEVSFDQQIDEERDVAYDALVRFYGCRPEPTTTPTPTPTATATLPPAGIPAGGIGGPEAQAPTPTRMPSPTPGATRTPSPTRTPGPPRTEVPTPSPYPRPTMPTVPLPTPIPHECPFDRNLCYFPGFGPPITMQSELRQGRTIIGYVGMSGRTTGPHLHLAISIYATGFVDVLYYERPVDESGNPVPEERLHYYARWTNWLDPLQFLPQANMEMGLAYMDQPLQLPGPAPIISEAGEGVWWSPGDIYSRGGGGRILGWINQIICGWFGMLCP